MKTEDSLWKIIQRYDIYFGSTNNKAAFLIAYNTFALGLLLVQLANIDSIVAIGSHQARMVFITLIGLSSIATIVSLVLVLQVVTPYLRSNKKPGSYHSIIYYKDVSEHNDAEAFLAHVKTYDAEKMVEDAARQVHVLSQGLASKFKVLTAAIKVSIWCQLPLIAALVGFILWRHL